MFLDINETYGVFFEKLNKREYDFLNYYEIIFMFITAVAHVYFLTDYMMTINNKIFQDLSRQLIIKYIKNLFL